MNQFFSKIFNTILLELRFKYKPNTLLHRWSHNKSDYYNNISWEKQLDLANRDNSF